MGLDRALLGVIERIYAAAREPGEWQPALEQAIDLLGAGHAMLSIAAPTSTGPYVTARIDERDLTRALAAAAGPASIEGAAIYATIPAGIATTRTDVMSDEAFARSTFYNEVVRPLDGFHSLSVQHGRPPASFFLTFCRPARAGNFGFAEARRLEALLPHFLNALELAGRLRLAEARSVGLERVIERLRAGVLLTDATARPVFINRKAAEIIAEGDGLGVEADGLKAATPAATRKLREAIAIARMADVHAIRSAHVPELDAGLRLRLARPSLRPALIASILPIWRLGIGGSGTACAAIVIDEPDAPAAIDGEALAETFRLTHREAEIAVLIGEGLGIGRIGATLGLGTGTVRNHLKRIFAKTETHSQAALVGLLRGFIAPAPPIGAREGAPGR